MLASNELTETGAVRETQMLDCISNLSAALSPSACACLGLPSRGHGVHTSQYYFIKVEENWISQIQDPLHRSYYTTSNAKSSVTNFAK